ncbi:MAG: outer membrane lipoprotein carrier protein LolA [Holophagales bacterium]|jgi:outer membrane lipoprotein-sorting protein|nr:outer membrane lipoprotein carrier protein LolA [Holophagales bacterium]
MTKNRFIFLRPLALALYFQLAAIAPGAELPSIKEIIEKFDAAQAGAETVQAPFTLSIKRSLLQNPAISKGTFYLQGSDFAHFVFSPPEDLVIRLTPKAIVSYKPLEKTGETLRMGLSGKISRKQLGLSRKLRLFSDYCKLEVSEPPDVPGTVMVTLLPKSISMKKRMKMVQIWIDHETWLPKCINWVERGGDAWLIDLGPIKANAAIPLPVSNFAMPPETPTRQGFSFFAARKK